MEEEEEGRIEEERYAMEKTKLANCVFFVVLAMGRSQRKPHDCSGIWHKGPKFP